MASLRAPCSRLQGCIIQDISRLTRSSSRHLTYLCLGGFPYKEWRAAGVLKVYSEKWPIVGDVGCFWRHIISPHFHRGSPRGISQWHWRPSVDDVKIKLDCLHSQHLCGICLILSSSSVYSCIKALEGKESLTWHQ